MTQVEEFPKHLKSENLCLNPRDSWFPDGETGRGGGGGGAEEGGGRMKGRGGLNSGSLLTAL